MRKLWNESYEVESINDVDLMNKVGHIYYCKDTNMSLRIYRSEWHITDLTNAMKRGKEVSIIQIKEDYHSRTCDLLNEVYILLRKGLTLRELFNKCLNEEIMFDKVKYYKGTKKGNEVYTPSYAKVSKLSIDPSKRFTKSTLMKVLKHKDTTVTRRMHLTDDYAYDNAVNYGEGDIIDREFMLKDSIEDWYSTNYVYIDKEDKNLIHCTIVGNDFLHIRINNSFNG